MTPEQPFASFASLPDDDKIKLYLVSLLGITEAPHPTDPTKKYTVHLHHPEVIEAPSLEIAKRLARERLGELYPSSKGWLSRTVTIEVIPSKTIAQIAQYWQAGFIANNAREFPKPVEFNCDSNE
jgi:hypothetical protein